METYEKVVQQPQRFLISLLFNPLSLRRHDLSLISCILNILIVAPTGDHVISLIDEISYLSPPTPLLSQYDDINPEQFCNGDNRPANCGANCMCTHKVDIPLNAIVEVVLVDEVQQPNLSHPFHLHGYGFNVIGNYYSFDRKTKQTREIFIEIIFSFSRLYLKVSVDRPIRQSRKSIWSMPSIWIVAVCCIVNMIYRPWKIRSPCRIMATLCLDSELIIPGEFTWFSFVAC